VALACDDLAYVGTGKIGLCSTAGHVSDPVPGGRATRAGGCPC
jgi:hypothetical protein